MIYTLRFQNIMCKLEKQDPSVEFMFELFSVIEYLNEYWKDIAIKNYNYEMFSSKYHAQIDMYFAKFKDHPVHNKFNELVQNVHDIVHIIELPFIINSNFTLQYNILDTSIFSFIKNNQVLLESFLQPLQSFCYESNFIYFYKTVSRKLGIKDCFLSKREIKQIITATRPLLQNNHYHMRIVVSPLLLGNYCINIRRRNKQYEVILVFSPYAEVNGLYNYGDKLSLTNVIFHEILHLVVNKLITTYLCVSNKVNNSLVIDNSLYSNYKTLLCEYFVRALATMFTEKVYKFQKIDTFINQDTENGFPKVVFIYNFLRIKLTSSGGRIDENNLAEWISEIMNTKVLDYDAIF